MLDIFSIIAILAGMFSVGFSTLLFGLAYTNRAGLDEKTADAKLEDKGEVLTVDEEPESEPQQESLSLKQGGDDSQPKTNIDLKQGDGGNSAASLSVAGLMLVLSLS